jgi:hypothetical protein
VCPLGRAPLPPQREPALRRLLVRYHVPTLLQLGIIAWVLSSWGYLSKVAFFFEKAK